MKHVLTTSLLKHVRTEVYSFENKRIQCLSQLRTTKKNMGLIVIQHNDILCMEIKHQKAKLITYVSLLKGKNLDSLSLAWSREKNNKNMLKGRICILQSQ